MYIVLHFFLACTSIVKRKKSTFYLMSFYLAILQERAIFKGSFSFSEPCI